MNWSIFAAALGIGLVVGVFGGLFGLAGGVILIPALVWFFHLNQHQAQGASLAALLFPTSLLGFWQYYKAGNADLGIGVVLAVGMFLGGYFGGHWAQHLSDLFLRRAFALLLLLAAFRLYFE